MLPKLAHIRLRASTLTESLVALAIASLMMLMVFSSLEYNILPVNPTRKLQAVLIADSLINLKYPQTTFTDTVSVRGIKATVSKELLVDTLAVSILTVKVYATPKHVLAERQQIVQDEMLLEEND